MANEIVLIKSGSHTLQAATETDKELIASWKIGKAVKVNSVNVSVRALKHHQMYWAGLIGLAFDYWETDGGLMAPSEKRVLELFSNWLDRKGGGGGAVSRASEVFKVELIQRRSGSICAPEKSKKQLHEWIKEEAGWFTWETTPTGLRKVTKSINFNSMDNDEFKEFYKSAFSVVWKFILSRSFESEAEAKHAMDNLTALG